MWFIWIATFVYWLMYLFTESNTPTVFDQLKFRRNWWTQWSLYSVSQVAHEEFFPRLSRLTVILLQWSIQGTIMASIISTQYALGAGIIAWSAVAAWIITLLLPFAVGHFVHRNIYLKYLIKYDLQQRLTKGSKMNQKRTEKCQEEIDYCDERIFTYFHLFYCGALITFFVCWPLTISRLQALPRTAYVYQWYWYWLSDLGSLRCGWPSPWSSWCLNLCWLQSSIASD